MSVCRRHTSRISSAGLLYTLEYEGDEQTAVNIVLLKNRTLVNVFERVRNRGGGRGGKGRLSFEGEGADFLLSLSPFFTLRVYMSIQACSRFNEEPVCNRRFVVLNRSHARLAFVKNN